MKKNNGKGNRTGAKIGAGVFAAALAAAGGYVLWEKMGKARREKVKTWVEKARKEVVKNIKVAKELSETEYKHLVDQAVKRYGSLSDANKEELAKAASDLKAEWKRIKSRAKAISKEVDKASKK